MCAGRSYDNFQFVGKWWMGRYIYRKNLMILQSVRLICVDIYEYFRRWSNKTFDWHIFAGLDLILVLLVTARVFKLLLEIIRWNIIAVLMSYFGTTDIGFGSHIEKDWYTERVCRYIYRYISWIFYRKRGESMM